MYIIIILVDYKGEHAVTILFHIVIVCLDWTLQSAIIRWCSAFSVLVANLKSGQKYLGMVLL